MNSAHLGNRPSREGNCSVSHWDKILFFSELISTVSTYALQYLSSLTLSLFKDTGWYFSDYSIASSMSLFGNDIECNFSLGPCLVGGGYFPTSRGYSSPVPVSSVAPPIGVWWRRSTWLPTNLPCLLLTVVCVCVCARMHDLPRTLKEKDFLGYIVKRANERTN